ncbi:hypothetical protein [Nonomuraea africana]|uniref:Uncharacterized protein n=1 Tax=Nonomuraea africana TaxID=46171 RepID=A0ABR9K7I2_9ACTN|nr:hypothetical protein [Nonomuraea africana]MBE1557956.1 hypothetical protein [Nonomuraea africana]
MQSRLTGMLIGAVFGAVFVFVNAASPLNTVVATVLQVAASVALAFIVFLWFTAGKRLRTGAAAPVHRPAGAFYGRGYLLIVAAEAVLLFGGIAVLRALGRPEQTNVAWIALIVGLHFVALAPVWKERSILIPGVVLTVLGVVGLVMTFTSAIAWVPIVSGVLSGVTLLSGSLAFSRRALASLTPAP